MLAIIILFLGILSRSLIHIPNFTPVIALSLFSGLYIKNKKFAILMPLIVLLVSDSIIGFHNTMVFTYGSVLLISCVGLLIKREKRFSTFLGAGFLSSFLFFVITNVGVWLAGGLYPLTREGLAECFILAIPFFKVELASTLIYTALFYGAYEIIASKIKDTKLASVLL